MDDPVVTLLIGIVLGILFTWGGGLLPGLLARYVFLRKPLGNASANWIAGLSCVGIAYVGVSMNNAAGLRGPVNIIPLILLFFVSRWIMVRDPVHRQKQREETKAKLQQMIDDPNIGDDRREWARDRLSQVQKLRS